MTTNTTTANDLLLLVFNATSWANVAINASSSPATQFWVALHTADPGAGGTQSTSEIAYTTYGRVAVNRNSGGFTVAGAVMNPTGNINFPTGTGGSGTATFASIGMLSSGAGIILWSGPISPNIVCGSGVTPTLTSASTLTIS